MSDDTATGGETKARKKRRMWLLRGWWWKWPVVVIVVFLAVWWGNVYRVHLANNATQERLRKDNVPITPEDMVWYYPRPEMGNAGQTIIDSPDESVDTVTVGREALFDFIAEAPPDARLPGELHPVARAFIEANVSKVRQALSLRADGYAWFPIDFTRGVSADMRHLGPIRVRGRLLQARAILAMAEGDAPKAVESIIGIVRLAELLRHEPHMISMLVRRILQADAVRLVERFVWQCRPTKAQLGQLAEASAPFTDIAMQRAMAGRLVTVLGYTDGTIEDADTGRTPWWYWWTGASVLDRAAAMDYFERAQRYLAGDGPRPVLRGAWYVYFAHALEIEMDLPLNVDRRICTRIVCTRTALAAERYRLAYGDLPKTLGELVPEYLDAIPHGAASGKPLRYVKSRDAVLIYGLGADGNDDGGVDGKEPGTDVVFTLPAAR